MLFHDGAHIVQPHAPVGIGILAGIERFKNLFEFIFADPHSAVLHADADLGGLFVAGQAQRGIPPGGDRGFPAIDQQVGQHRLHMRFIGQHHQAGRQVRIHAGRRIFFVQRPHRALYQMLHRAFAHGDRVGFQAFVQLAHMFQQPFVGIGHLPGQRPGLFQIRRRRGEFRVQAAAKHPVGQQLVLDAVQKHAAAHAHGVVFALQADVVLRFAPLDARHADHGQRAQQQRDHIDDHDHQVGDRRQVGRQIPDPQ